MSKCSVNLIVGLFLILGMLGLGALAIQVSGLTVKQGDAFYQLTAHFENIGGLKVRQPVRVAGVSVGTVNDITLDENHYQALVTLSIEKRFHLPVDTEASIKTEGVLGSKYLSLAPGYEEAMLQDGDAIEETHSAFILEDAIGQMLFNAGSDDKNKDKD